MSDTIFALATAPGRAAVAVVRISGPSAREAVERLSGRAPARRGMRLVELRDADGSLIDRSLVLWFPGPASYTGEDVAELHLHGGRAVIESVSTALLGLGVRPAEAGEFTRRAFMNGKLDLAQAEAVADLIDAESAAQQRQALGQLGGALSRRHEDWRSQLLDVLALLEANVDFPDEELPEDLAARARPRIAALAQELAEALLDARRGERVREGFAVAVIGAPNAGKSSIFNRVVGSEKAIVTPEAGTTRDVIEAHLVLDGYEVRIADTAGVRETGHMIEAEGVRRARASAAAADLRVWVVDGSASDGAWREALDLVQADDLCVLNKADLPMGSDGRAVAKQRPDALHVVATGEQGLAELRETLARIVVVASAGAEFPAVTRERHRRLLEEAHEHLVRASNSLDQGSELAAEDVRLAARALERVSGRIDPEEVLGRVFAQFCIGK
jgi:tRNA modification GTPase